MRLVFAYLITLVFSAVYAAPLSGNDIFLESDSTCIVSSKLGYCDIGFHPRRAAASIQIRCQPAGQNDSQRVFEETSC
ncbi:hypothetical protein F5050DRAFT_1750921 [Lentinula boryana]|uniref:Uncharacterized protein n=1 Tax=Lentinula boryana TaxID=40481 RepID=A0ABQ8QGD3_9AGAR|nr:hypothetical protein F5050DRAFT_1750921 [Lentinula boryana]